MTKQLNIDQHQPLHVLYPNDCCLCKAEDRIKELEEKIKKLEHHPAPNSQRLSELEECCVGGHNPSCIKCPHCHKEIDRRKYVNFQSQRLSVDEIEKIILENILIKPPTVKKLAKAIFSAQPQESPEVISPDNPFSPHKNYNRPGYVKEVKEEKGER